MTTAFDWSKFEEVKPSQSAQNGSSGAFDWNQYSPVPEKRGAYETFVERPGQIATQAAVAGLKALPRTGYDLLKSVVSATGGNLSNLEEAEKNAPQFLKDFAKDNLRTYEEIREEQKKTGKEFQSEKALAQPEGATERGIEKFGRFIGEAPAFGGVGGARGVAALGGLAGGLQLGEETNLGPMGQLVTGVLGSFVPGGAKAAFKSITSPRQTIAKGIAGAKAMFSTPEKMALQKQIINDAREAGIQLDIGSLTNSKLLKSLQTKLSQSSLTGGALDDLKKNLSSQVVNEYKQLADNLGKAQFETIHDAGESLQNALKAERDFSQKEYREIYNSSKKQLSDSSIVFPDRVISTIERLESELKPGSLKGTEQKAVLQFLADLKNDVMTADGHIKGAKVKDLINDKVAIHDIVNYEIEGGTKQLLKTLAKEIDDTIQQYGRVDPKFAKEYKLADKKFGEHARTFRNKNISSSLRSENPRQVLAKMNTTQGIRDVKKALQSSPEGRELFKDLSRFKLDQIFDKNLEKGASNQIQFGRFGNTLLKANNREIVRELVGNETFRRLEKLLKTSNQLADSANKFLNTSQSATNLVDLAFAGKLMTDISQLLMGNPWPFAKTGGTLLTTRQLSKLLANPEFLKMTEEAILASKTNNSHIMKRASDRLLETAVKTLRTSGKINEGEVP